MTIVSDQDMLMVLRDTLLVWRAPGVKVGVMKTSSKA